MVEADLLEDFAPDSDDDFIFGAEKKKYDRTASAITQKD